MNRKGLGTVLLSVASIFTLRKVNVVEKKKRKRKGK